MNFYFDKGNGKARLYDFTNSEYKTMPMSDVYKLKKRYYMFNGYEATDDGLRQYCNDFNKWVAELKNNDIFKFDYCKYKSHEIACTEMFKKLCYGKYENMEDIDATEYEYIESCNNSGLRYCKAGKYNCYGYDFSSQYPTILAWDSFDIPMCRGKEQTITEISKNTLQVGYYKVRITSQDERFNKVFAYSKKHVYCHLSVLFAFMCQTEGYDVNIELIQSKNNCYLYGKGTKDNIVKGSHVFGKWYKHLFNLKKHFPQNKLIKAITSQLWGRLSQSNKLFKTDDEIEEEGLDVVLDYDINHDYYIRDIKENKNGDDVCELVNCKTPYKYNLARLKPFLLAKSRYLTGKIAMAHIDDLVRIHTDCCVFSKEYDDVINTFKAFPITKEEKTSGLIEWRGVNCYKNYTNPKYTTKNYKDTELNDETDDENETT